MVNILLFNVWIEGKICLGQYPSNIRSISFLVGQVPALNWLSAWIPGFLKIPLWLFHQSSNKF
jgi:hypothetical protein